MKSQIVWLVPQAVIRDPSPPPTKDVLPGDWKEKRRTDKRGNELCLPQSLHMVTCCTTMQPVVKRKTPKSCPVPNAAQSSHSGHGAASASGRITVGQLVPTHTQPTVWRRRRMENSSSIQLCLAVPSGNSDLWLLKRIVWYLNAKFPHTCKHALLSSLCKVCRILPWAPLHECWRPSPWQGRELWNSTLVPRLSSGRSSLGLIRSDLAPWRSGVSLFVIWMPLCKGM